MSKYLYTTVYEKFTGMKPPEPQKEEKSERRRGMGHPYRMRLQQQETKKKPSTQKTETNRCRNPYRLRQFHQQNSGDNYRQQPEQNGHSAPQHRAQEPNHHQPALSEPRNPPRRLYEQPERKIKSAPKVMYKKKRQLHIPCEQEAISA